MYGNITIPGGIGAADSEAQEKLKKALKGATAEMNITGNAGTADKLKTARRIGNASFDGSANITLEQIGAAAADHGVHVTYSTATPKKAGTEVGAAAPGFAAEVARADHCHPAQTSVTGNAGTATKLQTARKITLTGAVAGNVTFDGSADVSLTTVDMNLPVVGSVTLRASGWTESGNVCRQNITIPGLTLNHQVDLYADYDVERKLTSPIQPVNDAGTFYAVTGEPPETDIVVQYTMLLTKKA